MKDILLTAELVIAIALGISILLQPKSSGMGTMGGEEVENFSTKRGAEKVLHTISVILAVLFGGIAAVYPFFV